MAKKTSKKTTLKQVENAIKGPELYVPASDVRREELRHLIVQHRSIVRSKVKLLHLSTPKRAAKDTPERGWSKGDEIPCPLPGDAALDLQATAERMDAMAGKLERQIGKALKGHPVYDAWLSKVFGVGPIVAGYLLAEVDIHRAVKPSQLRRFCGLAVFNGRLERPTRGQKLGYSGELRTRLYQAFASMWKNAAKTPGKTTKYLKVWTDYKHRMAVSDRLDGKRITIQRGDEEQSVSAAGFAHSTGWHKAADVLIEDLYVIMRAEQGLPVWPSWYAAKLGYQHKTGKIQVDAPKMLTMAQALDLVGDPGLYTDAHAEAAE